MEGLSRSQQAALAVAAVAAWKSGNQAAAQGAAQLQTSVPSAVSGSGEVDWNIPGLAYQTAQNPLLASSLTSTVWTSAVQNALAIANIDPDVMDLGDHFGLERYMVKRLHDQLKKRPETSAGDLEALWEILENARNPPALLQAKLREMEANTFIGRPKQDKDMKKLQKMYNLDDEAMKKLAEVLVTRTTSREEDMELLHRHLETSNRPSARVMTMLSKLRSGEPLPEPDKRVAKGSYLDRLQKKDDDERKKERSRSRMAQRERSNDRPKRERTEQRRRSPSRDRRPAPSYEDRRRRSPSRDRPASRNDDRRRRSPSRDNRRRGSPSLDRSRRGAGSGRDYDSRGEGSRNASDGDEGSRYR